MKLTPAQKTFIQRMRNGENVTYNASGAYLYKFGFDGIETITFAECMMLIMDKIINIKSGVVSLTELGKTIDTL